MPVRQVRVPHPAPPCEAPRATDGGRGGKRRDRQGGMQVHAGVHGGTGGVRRQKKWCPYGSLRRGGGVERALVRQVRGEAPQDGRCRTTVLG